VRKFVKGNEDTRKQLHRYKEENIKLNAKLTHKMVEKYIRLDDKAEEI